MLSVSVVTQELRRIIQDNSDLQDVWIQGEISEVSPTQNGILNFTIKGDGQKIECVIFTDRAALQGTLPPVGSSVFVKGQIYVYETASRYRFMVTDIHSIGGTRPTPFFSINNLTDTLKSTLNRESVEVQGKISKVFVIGQFTILELKDVTADEEGNEVIECVLLPGIAPAFPLQQGDRITVEGKFGIFSQVSAYQIEVEDANNIAQVAGPPMPVASPPNECQECGQHCEQGFTFCPICHYAQVHHEGIVVGAVMRYFERFADFSTQREYEICFGAGGNIIGRADVALLNSEGNPVAIAECKRIGYDGSDGRVQLEGYINPTVAKLGLFADNTDPYEWTFLKRNLAQSKYDEITRFQFEKELGVEPTPEIPPTKTQLELVQGNIIESKVEAIVNAADSNLTRGTGVDRAIRDAGGPNIEQECQEIFDREGVCPPGNAVITTGGNLFARYVIHAVGPIYDDGEQHEAETLARCYKNSLKLAMENGIRSVAFPAISTGNFRYPIEQATPVALNAVKEFVEMAQQNGEMVPEHIQFVLFDETAYNCYVEEFSNLGFGLSCLIG